MRSFGDKVQPIVEEVRRDIHWWRVCAQSFNGVSLILNEEVETPGETVQTDACLSGQEPVQNQNFSYAISAVLSRHVYRY